MNWKKMNWKKMMLAAVAVLGSVGLAAASTVTITFTNSYSGLGGPTAPPNSVYYYPYILSVNNGGAINVVCDDYYNNTYVKNPGESWLATVNTFTDAQGTGLTGGLFLNAPPNGYATYNNISTLQAYQEAAWLDSQFTNPSVNSNDWAAINFALWDLFDANAQTLNGSQGTSSAWWLGQAADAQTAGFSGTDFSDFVIYTPLSGWPSKDGMPQEFIAEVPEPATLLLLLGGLACLAGWEWRRRQLVTG